MTTISCGNLAPHECIKVKCLFCGGSFCKVRDKSWSPTNPYCSPICAYDGAVAVSLMNPFTRYEWARKEIIRLEAKLTSMQEGE